MSHIAAILGGSVTQANKPGPKVGGLPALVLHSSNEPGELSQWQCHYDNIIAWELIPFAGAFSRRRLNLIKLAYSPSQRL